VTSFSERVAEPLETLVQTITGSRAGRLNVLVIISFSSVTDGDAVVFTQARCLRLWRPSLSVISAAFMAFCMISVTVTSEEIEDTYRQILLVGKDQEEGIPELILVQHTLQLLTGLNNTVTIVAVNDEDDTLGVLEVMSPQRSDLVLSTDIPHRKLNVLVLDGLNVEAWRIKYQHMTRSTHETTSGSLQVASQTYRLWGWW
jgi:hypothetical protein